MIDSRMERWIKGSIALHFDNGKEDNFLFVEGQQINMANQAAWTELRINGPRYVARSGDHYDVELEINLACTVKGGIDLYAIDKMVGIFRKLAEGPILINKYEDTTTLTPAEYVGCFTLRDNEPFPLEVIPWGQMSVDSPSGPIRVMNHTIDAYYVMEL